VKSLFSLSQMLWTNELVCLLVASNFKAESLAGGGSTVVECLPRLVKVDSSSLAAIPDMWRKNMGKKFECLPTMCSSLNCRNGSFNRIMIGLSHSPRQQ
jgi:hypothetical protein